MIPSEAQIMKIRLAAAEAELQAARIQLDTARKVAASTQKTLAMGEMVAASMVDVHIREGN